MPDTKSQLTVTKRFFSRVDLIATEGRIDAGTAPTLDESLKASVAAGRYKLVIDFGNTDYISSAGLKVLVANLKEVKKHRGDVRLARLSRNLHDTFNMVGLTPELFKTYDDVLEAVGSF